VDRDNRNEDVEGGDWYRNSEDAWGWLHDTKCAAFQVTSSLSNYNNRYHIVLSVQQLYLTEYWHY